MNKIPSHHAGETGHETSGQKNLSDIVDAVLDELNEAAANFPAMHSSHEGWAVIMEEMDELWEHVKKKPDMRNLRDMRKEAIQVAAMGIRFAYDVCNEERGRR